MPAPWQDRDPAVRHEHAVGTEGGLLGWDHSDGQPIPTARHGAWLARRRLIESSRGQLSLVPS